MGRDLLRHGGHFARSIVAASLTTLLLMGQSALAENEPQSSPVPHKLLLGFLADNATFTLVDARSPAEFATSHINGAINVPHDSSGDGLSMLPPQPDAPIVVYCNTGKRARELQARLLQRGYSDVRVLLPEQIVWFEGMAVFNCGTPAAEHSQNTLATLITETKGEREP